MPKLIALMFTDIEGSTRLWEEHPTAMKRAVRRHDRIVDDLVVGHGGRVVDHAGDGVFAAFESGNPLACALAIQQRLQAESWGEIGELRVRIAIHAGRVQGARKDYRGTLANRTARIMATGWGGQILITPQAAAAFPLPAGAEVRELGEHVLKDLDEPQPICELVHPALKLRTFPALRSLSSSPNNLPPQTDSFIGREADLEQVCRLLQEPGCRLLTLAGPGGMGKSRLALESANRLLHAFRSGVYLVPLAALDSPGLVIPAIANAIGFNFSGREEPETQLLRFLERRHLLLVLDNFEHLLAAAGLVTRLLAGAPELKVLATSQEALRLRGEHVHALEGMPYPDREPVDEIESYSAVRLFVDRAHNLDPAFRLAAVDRAPLIEICKLVDGIPLGIELAAAWTRVLTCGEIAAEIQGSLDFLGSIQRDLPERHRSLRAVFEYSWKLISDEERAVLRRLSTFKDGFSREAAQKVTGARLDHLAALVDKSLLRRDTMSKYSIHELVRQLGEEKLREDMAEYARIRTVHSDFYADFVRQRRQELRGRNVKQAGEEIAAELENIRLGWSWALDQGRLEALDKSIAEMIIFFETRSRLQEGQAFFADVAARLAELQPATAAEQTTRHRLWGMALAGRGLFLTFMTRYEEAIAVTAQSLALVRPLGLAEEIGYALFVLAAAEQGLGQYETAVRHLEESIAELSGLPDLYRVTHSRLALAQLYAWLGEGDKAWDLYEAGLAACDEIGDLWAKMIGQMLLGELMLERGEAARARGLLEESLGFLRKLEDGRWIVSCLINLGRAAFESGDDEQARGLYQEGAAIARELEDRRRQTICLTALGRIEDRRGAREAARADLLQALRIGLASQSVPELLDALLELARGLVRDRETDQAAKLLSVVLAHPGSKRRTLVEARAVQASLMNAWAEGGAPEARTSEEPRLSQVVEEILAEDGNRATRELCEVNGAAAITEGGNHGKQGKQAH